MSKNMLVSMLYNNYKLLLNLSFCSLNQDCSGISVKFYILNHSNGKLIICPNVPLKKYFYNWFSVKNAGFYGGLYLIFFLCLFIYFLMSQKYHVEYSIYKPVPCRKSNEK